MRLVIEAIELIKRYDKVVICCPAGVSRSNSIAVGVLVKYFGISFEEACKLVNKKVPIADISACHLETKESIAACCEILYVQIITSKNTNRIEGHIPSLSTK